jgi:hypothetical protein
MVAGALVCGFVVAIVATLSCQRQPEPAEPSGAAPTGARPVWDHSDVRETSEDLRVMFEEHREAIEPETRETVDENLSLIDKSIGELVSAVESDPENARLHSLLLRAYQSQVRLLQRAVKLTKGGADGPRETAVPQGS